MNSYLWQRKIFLFINFFLSLNIWDFSFFTEKLLLPLKKLTPSFPTTPLQTCQAPPWLEVQSPQQKRGCTLCNHTYFFRVHIYQSHYQILYTFRVHIPILTFLESYYQTIHTSQSSYISKDIFRELLHNYKYFSQFI